LQGVLYIALQFSLLCIIVCYQRRCRHIELRTVLLFRSLLKFIMHEQMSLIPVPWDEPVFKINGELSNKFAKLNLVSTNSCILTPRVLFETLDSGVQGGLCSR